MKKKGKYSVGDIFQLRVDEKGNKGYGRILKIDRPSIFIELYKLVPTMKEVALEEIRQLEPILMIWSTDTGIKKGEWNIIGNIPVLEEVKMPDFWKFDLFDAEKVIIIRNNEEFIVKKDQIGEAQPFGIFGYEAVSIRYLHELRIRELT
ncbi:immunity 26/phosphotriesterase HocA family protein [Clostridium sp. CX1]|uniref:Immunity 26/phosphotriesterase HocA family protein n=1 Tax=Clostridium tanneri TaxID=3037988 RepID=A0ABU4JTG3_9CLOT|nr:MULTISPECIES: immunity 26/phosphotriesterase HocA family protein [unclassified Clostridium]MCT8975325.1 immunity 26/phosphotriesterase HocA family protein [Clostridium sp. CX1]MDW8801459.1 immunity 26/phosphotriesterase HocA family protein [Clostridium sp. A1-XYC3]